MKRSRFRVVEHFNGYAVYDEKTDRKHWLGDGVDVLFTSRGKAMKPGSEYFRRAWERALNENPYATAETYGFDRPEQEQAP